MFTSSEGPRPFPFRADMGKIEQAREIPGRPILFSDF
jgi:hypothetical protein